MRVWVTLIKKNLYSLCWIPPITGNLQPRVFIICSVIIEFVVFRHYCTVMVLDKFTMCRHALMLESHSGPSRIVNPRRQNMHHLCLKWNPNHWSINLQNMSFSLVLTTACSHSPSQREEGREREMIHLCGLVMLAQLPLERGQSTKKGKRRLVSLLQCSLSLVKAIAVSLNSTCLIQTHIDRHKRYCPWLPISVPYNEVWLN